MAAKKKPVEKAEEVEVVETASEWRDAMIEEALAEADEVDLDAPLPGTPVDFGVYEAPVGVPNPDPGDVVAAAQAAEAADEDEDGE